MFEQLRKLHRDDGGAVASEYIILLALTAVAAIAAWTKFGDSLVATLSSSRTDIEALSEISHGED